MTVLWNPGAVYTKSDNTSAVQWAKRHSHRLQRALIGKAGVWPVVSTWGVFAVLAGIALVLGAAVVPLTAACTVGAVVLVGVVASSWPIGRALMLGSLTIWVICSILFWWLWGVGFNAADASRPDPPIMALYTPSFFLGAASFVLFWGTLVVATIRGRDKPIAPSTIAD